MSEAAVSALLEAAFDGDVPARISAMVDRGVAGPLIEDFKVGPVLPFGGSTRPVRVTVSDQGEPDRWADTVRATWRHPVVEEWLSLGEGCRRMLDTDGGRLAELYLDDLQDHPALPRAEAMRPPEDPAPVMCLTVKVPSGITSCITRHETPPFHYLVGGLAEAVADLVDQGAEGIWGLRWRGERVSSVVWITEARWRNTAAAACAIADGLGPPPRWAALLTALAAVGFEAYPDAIELFPDGTSDLTVGALSRA